MRTWRSGHARITLAAALRTLCSPLARSEVLPRLEGRTLSGKQLIVPEATRGRAALLAFGFSRESRRPYPSPMRCA
jgi:hypothetical protein